MLDKQLQSCPECFLSSSHPSVTGEVACTALLASSITQSDQNHVALSGVDGQQMERQDRSKTYSRLNTASSTSVHAAARTFPSSARSSNVALLQGKHGEAMRPITSTALPLQLEGNAARSEQEMEDDLEMLLSARSLYAPPVDAQRVMLQSAACHTNSIPHSHIALQLQSTGHAQLAMDNPCAAPPIIRSHTSARSRRADLEEWLDV